MYYIIKNTENPSFVKDGFFNAKKFSCPMEATEYKLKHKIEGLILDMKETQLTNDYILRFKSFSEYVSQLSNSAKKALLNIINAKTPIKNFI
jgi:hypothetical protein